MAFFVVVGYNANDMSLNRTLLRMLPPSYSKNPPVE